MYAVEHYSGHWANNSYMVVGVDIDRGVCRSYVHYPCPVSGENIGRCQTA